MWTVEFTQEFETWWLTLDTEAQAAIDAAVDVLQERGPGCGRPLGDSITSSRHANMKELRPPVANIRILFAFDPRRAAIFLIGGDKTNRWQSWYRTMIPVADRLYDDHLAELRREGLIQ